ncbi:hypothetical protein BU23DRAFT_628374 [Bimuria novae-zelandiae CBS 107.79]|uniref:Uncharacterized protein n=1 Tax=Bimuria novae-zelandiae CBS 107.79 TaxID=1447943 RepID=A0A6A5VJ32_9PLEO|nr:hypothetical protein BU23DRAFT_628374 [Bimuria novae-zelandiae CBS 107.79]
MNTLCGSPYIARLLQFRGCENVLSNDLCSVPTQHNQACPSPVECLASDLAGRQLPDTPNHYDYDAAIVTLNCCCEDIARARLDRAALQTSFSPDERSVPALDTREPPIAEAEACDVCARNLYNVDTHHQSQASEARYRHRSPAYPQSIRSPERLPMRARSCLMRGIPSVRLAAKPASEALAERTARPAITSPYWLPHLLLR